MFSQFSSFSKIEEIFGKEMPPFSHSRKHYFLGIFNIFRFVFFSKVGVPNFPRKTLSSSLTSDISQLLSTFSKPGRTSSTFPLF